MKKVSLFKTLTLAVALSAGLSGPALLFGAEEGSSGQTKTLTGEVVDLMCYLDHGAKGEKHKSCAEKCIKGGGPVGLLSDDQLYLVIGEHKPMNDELSSKAAQTVTLKGKVVERNGMKMIENAQLVEK
jgi:hypothetical protein